MVHSHDDNSHFTIHRMLNNPMSKIYFFQAFLTFVKALYGVFIPVYFYSIGYELDKILIFFMIASTVYLSLAPINIKQINKIGFKLGIVLSLPFFAFFLWSVNYITPGSYFIYISALFYGIHNSLFWPCMHSEIAMNGHNEKRSSEMGTLQVIITMVTSMAPLVGGIFFEFLSYINLLIFSLAIIIIGFIPFLFSKDIFVGHNSFKYKYYIEMLKNKKHRKSLIAFAGEGIENTIAIFIWPILLFILLDNKFLTLGTLYTIVSLISVVILTYSKSYFDSHNRNKLYVKSSEYLTLNWSIRILFLFFTSFFIFIVESLYKLGKDIFLMQYYSIFYNNAKKENYMYYIMLRELGIHGSRLIYYPIIILTYHFFNLKTQDIVTEWIFISIIIIAMASTFLVKELKEY